ncbi:MAG: hypothetical protein CBE41_04675 [Gammaproteobacteria bacterium TMED281]|nr:MAG: hypothetical protein CBE41_04675 [Gammaproteobacteria bacterium TMED281]
MAVALNITQHLKKMFLSIKILNVMKVFVDQLFQCIEFAYIVRYQNYISLKRVFLVVYID